MRLPWWRAVQRLLLPVVFLLVSVTDVQARVIYVDADAAGAGDGSTWTDAHTSIQSALDTAVVGDGVWVAEGVYRETVNLVTGVSLYGGFQGTESGLAERDLSSDRSIIHAPSAGVAATSRALVLDGVTAARIDGFLITGGRVEHVDDDSGAGVLCDDADDSNTIANCIIAGNAAQARGGGVLCDASSPLFVNCVISGNAAVQGGGIACLNGSSPTLRNCTIADNSATTGAGLHCEAASCPVLANCIFAANGLHAVAEADESSDPTLSYCLFDANGAVDYLDEAANGYLGSSAIDANVAGARLNTDGDPCFAARPAGSWTSTPVYDADRNVTTLEDAGAAFTADALVGELLNPNTDQHFQVLVIGNSATTLELSGDVTGCVSAGDVYQLVDYLPGYGSAAIDTGTDEDAPAADAEGNARPVDIAAHGLDGTGGEVDIGAFEAQSVHGPIFVDADVEQSGDGTSWAQAKRTISEALAIAQSGARVWVAAGTYQEIITLPSGVGLYGGFAGTEQRRYERDTVANPTVIDGATSVPRGWVVLLDGVTATHFDGFSITGVQLLETGQSEGAIVCREADHTNVIANCTVTGIVASGDVNWWYYGLAAICCQNATPRITGCTLTDNDITGIYFDCYWGSSGVPIFSVSDCAIMENATGIVVGGDYYGRVSADAWALGEVAIDGNEVTGSTYYGVLVDDTYGLFGQTQVTNNVVSDNGESGIAIYSGDYYYYYYYDDVPEYAEHGPTVLIDGNEVTDNSWEGVYCYTERGDIEVTNNVVTGSERGVYVETCDPWSSYYYYDDEETVLEPVSTATIQGNEVSGNSWEGVSWQGLFREVRLSNNTVAENGYGVYFWGWDYWYWDWDYVGEIDPLPVALIDGNEITDNGWYGVCGYDLIGEVWVTNNTITGNEVGLEHYSYYDYWYYDYGSNFPESWIPDWHINENVLSGNTSYDVTNFTGWDMDARHNWWGEATFAEMQTGEHPRDISVIYDRFDESWCGIVNYSGWLDGENGTPVNDTHTGEVRFTDADGDDVGVYVSNGTAYVHVSDADMNVDATAAESVEVTVSSDTTGWVRQPTATWPQPAETNAGASEIGEVKTSVTTLTEDWTLVALDLWGGGTVQAFSVRGSVTGRHTNAPIGYAYSSDNAEVSFGILEGVEYDETDVFEPGDTFTFSTTAGEMSGETVLLTETGPDTGEFTGTVQLVDPSSRTDGDVAVMNGDSVYVLYFDEIDDWGRPRMTADTALVGLTVTGGSIPQSVTWVAEHSPYVVTSNVTVASGATLTIEPGVEVLFLRTGGGAPGLIVNGGLVIQGTSAAPVVLTSGYSDPEPGDWGGIVVNSVVNGTGEQVLIDHCRIEYAQTGVQLNSVAVAVITNSIITECSSYAIHCSQSDASISGNIISDSYYGIYCYRSSPTIENNEIVDNSGNGIDAWSTDAAYPAAPVIVHNTIARNSAGISCWRSRAHPVIYANMISENSSNGIWSHYDAVPDIANNSIVANGDGIEFWVTDPAIAVLANNLAANTSYQINNRSSCNVDATGNW